MKKINANFDGYKHDIIIGNNILNHLISFFSKNNIISKLNVITDKNVAHYHLRNLLELLKVNGFKTKELILDPGEKTKDWKNLKKVTEWLISNQVERNDIVISFGGGVIGDLVGFSASIVRRGIKIIHLPTTLLAQVDSAIGGKTGINSDKGKNLIGTFHQPSLILSDISFLKTLKRRDFLSGYAEAIKKALIKDYNFFEWLETKDYLNLIEDKNLIELVYRSTEIKVKIVQNDEKEKGDRALLNLGHTFGHSLESANNYSKNLLHGEAVIIGCCLALELSKELGFIIDKDVERVKKYFQKLNYKTTISKIKRNYFSVEQLVNIMYQDKKVVNKQLNFILLKRIGKGVICTNVDINLIKKILSNSLKY